MNLLKHSSLVFQILKRWYLASELKGSGKCYPCDVMYKD